MHQKTVIRWIGLLLSLVLVLGLLPAPAFAVTEDPIPEPIETATKELPVVLAAADPVDYYGRTALSALPNSTALLYAYDQIAAGVEICAATISVYNGTDPITAEELQTVMDTYRRDYTHHFWMAGGYSYSMGSVSVLSVKPSYLMSGAELEAARAAFDAKVATILSGITGTMNEYEKALYLHDTLASIVTYQSATHAHDAYGALVEGTAVCDGYAEALQCLLQQAGIQSFIAIGDSAVPSSGAMVGHAWNYVRIDGAYYHTDLSWDDQGDTLYHTYFNQTDAVILEDHLIDSAAYALPTCTSTAAQYFTGKDTYLSTYTADTIGQLLKENGMMVHVYIPGSTSDFLSWYKANVLAIAQNAGVTGGFSYGYSHLGKELVLRLQVTCSHTSLTQQPAKEPTPTAPGHMAYYKCSCGRFFEDASASVQITDFAAWKNGKGKLVYTPLFSGSCGENLTWSFENETLTISGTGAMTNYTADSPAPWFPHSGSIQKVVLASGITKIGTSAFASCDQLSLVYFPGTAEQISVDTGNESLKNATWHYLTVLAQDDLRKALSAATQSGTTVMLTQDLAVSSATIRTGITLDLNGCNLETKYFTCYGDVVDGATGGNGLLKATNGIHIAGKASYLPIYDSTAGGYRFYQYQLQNLGFKRIDGNPDICKVGIRLTLANAAGYDVLTNTTDPAIDAIASIHWGKIPSPLLYTFSDSTLRKYAAQVSADLSQTGSSSKAITLTISGLSRMEENTAFAVQPSVATLPGVTAQGDTATWTKQ